MSNCLVCKTGKLIKSGCHEYCDTCDFSQFIVTGDYLAASTGVLAELLSNTRYPSREAVESGVRDHIRHHLPALNMWLTNIASGMDKTIQEITDTAVSQAINVVIGADTINEQSDNSLVCHCGCDVFFPDKSKTAWNHIECSDCATQYYSDETTKGLWVPYFKCSCNNISYDKVEGTANIISCRNCELLYTHDPINGIFRKMV